HAGGVFPRENQEHQQAGGNQAAFCQRQGDLACDLTGAGTRTAGRFFQFRTYLQQSRGDQAQAIRHPNHAIGQPHTEDGATQGTHGADDRASQPFRHGQYRQPAVFQRLVQPHGHEQEHPQEGQTGQQTGHRTWHQHAVVQEAGDTVWLAVHGQTDKGVADHCQGTPKHTNRDRVQNGAQQVGLPKDLSECIQRKHVHQRHPNAPVGHKGTQHHADNRHDHGKEQPQCNQGGGSPAPAAQWQRASLGSLALDGYKAVGGTHQTALQHHQRNGHGDQNYGNRGHQVIGRDAQLVGQLVQVGGQDQVALGITQHQNQTKHFQAQEKQQYAGIENGRANHGQADRAHYLPRAGTGTTGGFFHVRSHAAQGGGNVQVGVWNVGQ